MITPESLQVTQLVTNLLDKLAIPYVIGGSVASTIFGMPRMTMDVDIVVALPHLNYPSCLNAPPSLGL